MDNLAANIPSDPTNQRRSIHRKLRNSSNVKPTDRVVSLQPPGLPHGRQPSPPWCRSGFGSWFPLSGPICQSGPIKEHCLRWLRRLFSRCWACSHPQHVPHYLWNLFVQGRRAVDCTKFDFDGAEEATGPASDSRGMG